MKIFGMKLLLIHEYTFVQGLFWIFYFFARNCVFMLTRLVFYFGSNALMRTWQSFLWLITGPYGYYSCSNVFIAWISPRVFGFFPKFKILFEKMTSENRVFGHRLVFFLGQMPYMRTWQSFVGHNGLDYCGKGFDHPWLLELLLIIPPRHWSLTSWWDTRLILSRLILKKQSRSH